MNCESCKNHGTKLEMVLPDCSATIDVCKLELTQEERNGLTAPLVRAIPPRELYFTEMDEVKQSGCVGYEHSVLRWLGGVLRR